jgi:hypothetical protein
MTTKEFAAYVADNPQGTLMLEKLSARLSVAKKPRSLLKHWKSNWTPLKFKLLFKLLWMA